MSLNKLVKASIDEFTASFRYGKEQDFNDVDPVKVIEKLVTDTGLDKLGTLERAATNLQGYNTSYNLEPFDYPKFSFHSNRPSNGIAVRFTATSLKTISNQIETRELISSLFEAGRTCGLQPRLTRVDIAIDVLNGETEVYQIEPLLNTKQVISKSRVIKGDKVQYCKSTAGISSITNDNVTNTIYVGANKSRTGFLRIYNKKFEQISKGVQHSNHWKLANECQSWVRYEAVFKDEYAHQAGDIISQTTQENYIPSLAGCFNKRYNFFDENNELTLISKDLYEVEKSTNGELFDFNITSRKFHQNSKEQVLEQMLGPIFQNQLFKLDQLFPDDLQNMLNQAIEFNRNNFEASENVKKTVKRIKKNEEIAKEAQILKNEL